MGNLLIAAHLWIKALHIVAVIAWMAGMLYLPRLFVYHSDAPVGSPQSETFKVMERKLLRMIINPAMIATWLLGGLMLSIPGLIDWSRGFMWVKLFFVLALSGFHGFYAVLVKAFARDERRHSVRFYRMINEIPMLFAIIIVIMIVVRPF
ncbi:MAG: protoporphyrinogen oxidase HemJ [Alphaproteobacteria bacterium]